MNENKKPASPESRTALYVNMGKTIEVLSLEVKNEIIRYEALNTIIGKSISNIDSNRIFNVFLSLQIYIQYMNIELYSLLRACFRATLPSEKRYNIKYINCVILESYKYLYGYKKNQKKSLWMTKVKPLVSVINEDEFSRDFKIIESNIIEFGENNITNKMQRDLSFHYDIEPKYVYKMLIELSEEEETQRMIYFMKLLQEIFHFVLKYVGRYKPDDIIAPSLISKFSFSFSDFDIFHNKKDTLYMTLESKINDQTKCLDKFILQQRASELINQKLKEADQELKSCIFQIVEVEKVVIQLTYLYIDLASAFRAFISSEYTIEKQLSLKKICIIVYEGFNKLYGLNSNKENTFMKKYIYPIISSDADVSESDEFNVLIHEFALFGKEINELEDQRHLSVHYNEGIVEVYNMLHNLNPTKEFDIALRFLDILHRTQSLFTRCLNLIDLRRKAIYEKKMEPTNQIIDNLINLLENTADTPQKKDIIRIMNKIRTGELFNEIINKRIN